MLFYEWTFLFNELLSEVRFINMGEILNWEVFNRENLMNHSDNIA